MHIFRSLEEARGQFGPCALTIGNFDGVHCAHQSLFAEVAQLSRKHGWKPSVLTFDPHPTKIVAPGKAPRLLTTIEQRCRYMEQRGITQVLILPFDASVASLSAEDFVQTILTDALQTKAILVGEGFRFGHKQAGGTELLARMGDGHGFIVRPVPAVEMRGSIISSSEIRRRILAGDVSKAARMLGRFYSLEGKVVKGHGIGSAKTVPTLNLETPAEVLPAVGVYVTRTACLDTSRRWPSVSNIGSRPTFGGEALTIETYLLDPLQGDPLTRIAVEFTHRIRDERRFEGPEALKQQILRDVRAAQNWHRRTHSLLSRSAL
ncbi:MAG TPA: bifunctional riboflavin kinase/FAD synthetase [Bryobacteraceae bacterium]|nr:bifunctional riboflavin kinase/FAD synthetase [Bryobacteraceae bacterium]